MRHLSVNDDCDDNVVDTSDGGDSPSPPPPPPSHHHHHHHHAANSSYDAISNFEKSPRTAGITYQQRQQQQEGQQDDHEGAVEHSLPNPDEIVIKPSQKHKRRHELLQTIAGVGGNILEWYDFAVFGFFGDIIGDNFFPPQSGHAAIIESFAVFGGAFLMRPLGGILMGHIGDVQGRKRALEISIFLMAVPTFLMGCLPTYDMVGWFAFVLLILVRLVQGLSVGGQLMASLVFTVEKHPKPKWGLYGSYVMSAANFGTLIGGIVGFALKETLNDDQLHAWGWRVPFLSGVVIIVFGLYLRFYGDEEVLHGHSPDGEAPPNPVRVAFSKDNRRSLLSASMVPLVWGGGFYLTFVWMAIFMEDLIEPPIPHAFAINSSALFVSCCLLFPIAGILSDMYGRRIIMIIGAVSFGVLSPLMVISIGTSNPAGAFFAQCIMGVSLSLWGSPMCAWLVESFPPAARLTSVSIGYNIAQALGGGLSPAAATAMVDGIGPESAGLFLSGLAALSLIGLCIAPPSYESFTTDGDDAVGGDGLEISHLHKDSVVHDKSSSVTGDETSSAFVDDGELT